VPDVGPVQGLPDAALRHPARRRRGAVPLGRFRGLAQELKKPLLKDHLLNNIFFDTCVYHQPGIDLLTKVIPVDNILFASEMIGAVRGIDPETGYTTTTPSATSRPRRSSSATTAQDLRRQRAPRVPALDAALTAKGK
jgi:4-oxalmesaconate hydratase